jgi:DNA ligase (NAD+)
VLGRVIHFASKGGVDIDGLGDKLAAQLINNGLIHDPADLYSLTKEQLLPLELMASKRADNLLAQIDRSRSAALPRLIYALGIIGVGEAAAVVLAERLSSFTKIASAATEELEEISGIGPVIARSIHQFFDNRANQKMIEKLKDGGVLFPDHQGEKSGDKLAGKTFVITGTLSQPRLHFKNLIVAQGGKVSGSVSAKTDYLLAGDEAGSKREKAEKLGVTIISEADLDSLLD